MKKRKQKFPKYLFVNWFEDSDGSKWPNSFVAQQDAVDDDGPTDVATYVLVKVNRLTKRLNING